MQDIRKTYASYRVPPKYPFSIKSPPCNPSKPLKLIGINPYVYVPDPVLAEIFKQAGRAKGPHPIQGTLHGTPYQQTLVKYAGAWRLYINRMMLKNSPKRIGEVVEVTVQHDPEPREILPPAQFVAALARHPEAQRG